MWCPAYIITDHLADIMVDGSGQCSSQVAELFGEFLLFIKYCIIFSIFFISRFKLFKLYIFLHKFKDLFISGSQYTVRNTQVLC